MNSPIESFWELLHQVFSGGHVTVFVQDRASDSFDPIKALSAVAVGLLVAAILQAFTHHRIRPFLAKSHWRPFLGGIAIAAAAGLAYAATGILEGTGWIIAITILVLVLIATLVTLAALNASQAEQEKEQREAHESAIDDQLKELTRLARATARRSGFDPDKPFFS